MNNKQDIIFDKNTFKSTVIGTDPISGGAFEIVSAYITRYPYSYFEEADCESDMLANGKFVIRRDDNNPLFKLAETSPLRLQNLVASVNFGGETRFIKIVKLDCYEAFQDEIHIGLVKFKILDNIEYLEKIEEYKNNNLLG